MPMTGRTISLLSLIALAVGLASCGGDGTTTTSATGTTTTTDTATQPPETVRIRVYYLLDDKVQPVGRDVPTSPAVAKVAFGTLLGGPTTSESELGLTTALPTAIDGWSVALDENGVLTLDAEGLSRPALAQAVYTLTQFATVKQVEIDGKRYTRKSFEDETPAILVESPLAFETVSNPIRATGTANTFEATFQYEVVDPAGKVVDTHFVTATSGTGTRGTFDFTTKPYTGEAGQGALVVLELSAKDGSRINEVRVPLQLEP